MTSPPIELLQSGVAARWSIAGVGQAQWSRRLLAKLAQGWRPRAHLASGLRLYCAWRMPAICYLAARPDWNGEISECVV